MFRLYHLSCPVFLVFLLLLVPRQTLAQPDLTYPSRPYYVGLRAYYDGDYRGALTAFQSALRTGVRSTEGRWVDAICYHTMIGECYYQMGDIGQALEQYEAALQLAVFHNNWMLRVQFPDVEASASVVRTTINWGVSKRNTVLARIPNRMGTVQGQSMAANEEAATRGGIVALPQIFPLDAKEVARCTAVAIRRRHQLMGPVCRHTPLTAQVLAALGSRPTLPNHWSQAWISCQLGLAYASAGKPEQAASELTRSLVLAGQYDHELTALALVALGDLAFEQGQTKLAADYFLEASFAAAAFDQFDLLHEAFEGGLVTHLISGQAGLYPPLPPARAWSQRHSRALEAWLLLLAAENYAHGGDAVQAAGLLGQARQTIGTREMRGGRIGGRFNYLSALVDFQQGNLAAGTKSLTTALAFEKASSAWLMQIGLADTLYASGEVTQRVAEDLYNQLLREPTSADWTTQPLQTLAVVTTPHAGPLRRWFEVALLRKDEEKAFEIADRIRRHRFYSTLPMGGRLLALRWIMEAPEASLSPQAVLQRQDILARYPEYARLSGQGVDVLRRLRTMALVPEATEQRREQSQLLDQVGKISAAQELLLSGLALRREASEFVFPPLLGLKQIQQRMPAGQLLLTYSVGDRGVTAFAVDKERIATWQVESPETLGPRIASLLQQIGVRDRRTQVEVARLRDNSWQQASVELLQQLSNVRDPATWDSYREVVIVPDGLLWYVPFEALHVTAGEQGQPLIAKVPVRYAPTASLANLPGPGLRPQAATAVVAGRILPGQDPKIAIQASDAIGAALPGTVRLGDTLPAPSSLFSVACDRLIVLSELDQTSNAPYGWSPMQIDRGKRGADLASWFTLPWQGPEQIILPGYQTPASTSLKGATGAEIFLPLCGLMASGARTVLISRWPLGGQSTFDLVREYAQELPYVKPSEAWRRSVLLNSHNPIDPVSEPRLRADGLLEEIGAAHPLFWAGYLLVDSGTEPARNP